MTRRQRIRRIAAAAAAAAALVAGGITGVYQWPGGSGGAGGGGLGFLLLDLRAARDFGAHVPRGTSTGQWCGPVGGVGVPAHCWEIQQSSGDATDYGTPGGWHLTPAGSPRVGAVTGLPVAGSTVDWSTELATWGDGGATTALSEASATLSATDVISVSFVWRRAPGTANQVVISHRQTGSPNQGWFLYTNDAAAGVLRGTVDNGPSTCTVESNQVLGEQWACTTIVLDARTTDAGAIYNDGMDDTKPTVRDLSGCSGFTAATTYRIHGWAAGWASSHGVARARLDDGVALTLAQHRALCGSWGLTVKSTHRTANDITWTQSGGARCYPASATTATCYPGGAPAARWTATGFEWATDAQGAVNRVLYSTAIDCTNWTCSTATAAASVAPDGSKTAASITMGGGYIEQTATGYTVSTAVNVATWAKCSSGTLDASNVGGAGHWTVDCSTVGGSWALLTSAHSAVTEVQAWSSTGAGAVNMRLSGADAEVWAPTITENPTTGAVIPTAAAAVDTGSIAWTIDNSTGSYWRAGANVLQTLDTVDGTCLVTGSTLRLSGASGSECVGGWSALKVWQ